MTEERNIKFSKHKEIKNICYKKFDFIDAINIPYTDSIPSDYKGMMGVPISFLDKYNPEQFEIIGLGCGDMAKKIGIKKNHRGRTDLAYLVNGVPKCPYSRILIRRKVNPNEN